ncbi:N-acetylneuraminate synthase [Labilibaculum euxinus]
MGKVFIIAEAGVNHNGDIELAKQLIDVAVEAKADAVKFQTWKTELLVSKDAKMADYQIENTGIIESQYDMLKKLELSYNEFRELKKYCDRKNILFLSTPDEEESADFLNSLQNIFKIGSAELTNIPFLRHIASFKKEIILSTGMGTMVEIEIAVRTLLDAGITKNQITLLHVTTQYPTPMVEVNLKAMLAIKDQFGLKVGYSDHTMGTEVPIAAVALGAQLIEKHFTLDRNMPGPDHQASLNPEELKYMVIAIRNIEKALGDGNKKPSASESKNKEVVRKCIIALCEINKNAILSTKNIGLRRITGGIPSIEWDKVLGQKAKKDFKEGDLISL